MKFPIFPFGTKPTRKPAVKEVGFLAYLSRFQKVSLLQHSGKNTGILAVPFSITCQLNLTKPYNSVENIDKTSHFQKMANIGKLGRGLALAGALTASLESPALADSTDIPKPINVAASSTSQQVDSCVTFVKGQRSLAKENGVTMSRGDQKRMLHECNNGQLEARIVEQGKILAALGDEIKKLKLRVDKNARILDENNNVIAQIIAINGEWVIQRKLETDIAVSRTRQEEILQEAERILKRLATS